MEHEEKMDDIREELKRVYQHTDGNWSKCRSISNYKKVEITYPFGKRNALKVKDQNLYEATQCSRGLQLEFDEDVGEALEKTKEQIKQITEIDIIRMDELKDAQKAGMLKLAPGSKFMELGFRLPKLLEFYKQTGLSVGGIDVVPINVMLAKKLGYDVELGDLNNPDFDLNLGDSDLVVAYNVLEHVTNPLLALQNIYKSMKPHSFLHIEVPIEVDGPHIKHGHLFPFWVGDLGYMLKLSGFEILCLTNKSDSFNVLADEKGIEEVIKNTDDYYKNTKLKLAGMLKSLKEHLIKIFSSITDNYNIYFVSEFDPDHIRGVSYGGWVERYLVYKGDS